ncbi:glycine-rich domain-containing protein [Streptantibioticus silvisoli]
MKMIMGMRVSRAVVGVLALAGGALGPLGAAGPAQAALPTCAKVMTVTTAKLVECRPPARTSRVRVSLVGAGGGGGGTSNFLSAISPGGGGGGGGALIECTYTPTTEDLIFALSVGAGGKRGTNSTAGGKGGTTYSSLGGRAEADGGNGGKPGIIFATKPQAGKGGAGGSGTYPQTSCYDRTTGTRTPGSPGTSNNNGGTGGAAARPLPAGCPTTAGRGGKGSAGYTPATPGRPGCARVEFLTGTN